MLMWPSLISDVTIEIMLLKRRNMDSIQKHRDNENNFAARPIHLFDIIYIILL